MLSVQHVIKIEVSKCAVYDTVNACKNSFFMRTMENWNRMEEAIMEIIQGQSQMLPITIHSLTSQPSIIPDT